MVKKIKINSKPIIVKEDRFSTITFSYIFPCEREKKDIFIRLILKNLLLNSNYNYKEEDMYIKEKNKRMIISIYANTMTYNKITFIELCLSVPDPKVIKIFDLEKAFQFFHDSIYNPNMENNSFIEKQFLREKSYFNNDILEFIKKPQSKAYQSFLDIVDDKGIIKRNDVVYNIDLLNQVTLEDVNNYYFKNIKNNTPLMFVSGNIDKEIENMLKKYTTDKDIIIKSDYYDFLIPFKKVKIVEEESNCKESFLKVAYKVKNMKEEDLIYLEITKNIIKSNRLMINKLRLEQKLVYHTDISMYKFCGMLVINATLNNKSKDVAIKGIKEVINSLLDENNLKLYLNNLIQNMEYDLLRNLDSKYTKLDNTITNTLKYGATLEEKIKLYKNIDIKQLKSFISRLKLDTIYFLRGEFNE